MFSDTFSNYTQKIEDEKLWTDKYWKALLHIPVNNKSEIDSPNFFLSTNGQLNPKEELIQTLNGLFDTTKLGDDSIGCKFPARKSWLIKRLSLKNLPNVSCSKFDKWFKQLDATSATLVFPSAHINSPASMFGHTFLRINSSYNSKLLSYAVNYAANADKKTENGFIFAIKGLFGGYYGQYNLLPYYEKLKQYRDTEQRDIWEYNLNLTKNEVVQMVKHIWELKDTYSNYYFFDENCSYNMLWLLEIARPTVTLRDRFFYQVSPPETIFEIVNANLVKSKDYRPSKRKVLTEYENYLNSDEIVIAKLLSTDITKIKSFMDNKNFSLRKKQLILESATELAEYYYIQGKTTKSSYLEISHNLSKNRAFLGNGNKIEISPPTNPDQAHRQLSFSLGYRNTNEDNFLILGLRPTYHDITNNDTGFLVGTQIEFFTPQFLYDVESHNLKVDYLKLLTISSLAPQTKFFKPFSWSTSWQFDRESLNDNLNFNGKVSGGKAYSIGNKNFVYALADAYLYPTHYSNTAFGGTFGAIAYTSNKTKLNLESSYKIYDNGDDQKKFSISQSYFPQNNIDIKLNYTHVQKYTKNDNSVNLTFHYFF